MKRHISQSCSILISAILQCIVSWYFMIATEEENVQKNETLIL